MSGAAAMPSLLADVSDREIALQVGETDLISLLLTVSGLLDDPSLLRPEFRPNMIASAAGTGIDYGLDEETLARIRDIVIEGLTELRDSDATPRPLSPEYLETALAFIAGDGADPAYLEVLRRELAWGEDTELPAWKLGDLAPSREFRVAIIGAGDYVRAVRDMQLESRRVVAHWGRDFDLLLTPTLATRVPEAGVMLEQANTILDGTNEREAQMMAFMVPANVTGLPAISVPAGYDRDGLPLGAHLMGAPFGEAALIRVASRLEAELRWDLEHPGLYVGEPR